MPTEVATEPTPSKPAVTNTAEPQLTDGFHLVIEALKRNGIETIYGVPGIPITDLSRLSQAQGMRFIAFRHEQNAGYAAAITGYLTQKPGICLTVSAPGFLNGLGALAHATTNCFPMIQISGSSERHIIDLQQGDYEEMDQMNVARPFTKASFRINRAEDIGIGIARAIRAAVSGRPGGVYLDLPGAVLAETIDANRGKDSVFEVVDPAPAQIPSVESITRAVDLLKKAERPLVVLGKGAAYSQADQEIRSLIEIMGIPYVPMSMAKGLLPDTHPQSAAAARSLVLAEADLVLLIGARLNWLLGHGKSPQWSATARFIQIDIDAAEMDSNRHVAAPIVGDIKSAVTALLAAVKSSGVKTKPEWLAAIDERKKQNVAKMAPQLSADPHPMNFSSALAAINNVLKDRPDVYLVNEGANTLDICRNIVDIYEPRHRLDVGTWGVMGIGMGYSIGAAISTGKQVVGVHGDSAFGFSGMDFETVCRYHLPVVSIVFNNGGVYRGVGVNQGGGNDPAPTMLEQSNRYDLLGDAFGGKGYYASDTKTLSSSLREAIQSGKPALINCIIDPKAGTESGHISKLNPKSALEKHK
ncbi:MAG: oxalyl-CoA decarboxylase [Deltaproteobacteria bacterium]|nr:oxalyl-CoA decarboxylase [Deltaproteobacteria bacterium]